MNVANNVGSALASAWENFKNFMKATGEAISDWWSRNWPTVVTLGAMAAVTVAAIALAPYTGGTSLALAAFADGGVITSPTVGLVGEYTGAKTNPEIITPENKMREIFNESNGELAILLDKNNKLLTELLNKDTSITIGDETISASAARGAKSFKRRTGQNQFAI